MKTATQKLYKDVATIAVLLVLAMVLCRFSKGYFTLVLAMLGVSWACSQAYGKALICFAIFPLLVVIDSAILPKPAIAGYVLRLAPLLIGLCLALTTGQKRGLIKMPFGMLFLYLAAAVISSATGWSPMISYMKMVNFIIFLVGIWLGTPNLQNRLASLQLARVAFLALICIVVFGNILTLPFPAIGYSTSFMNTYLESQEAAVYALAELQARGGVSLFSGLLNHSQALAPLLACCIAFTAADMLFVEKRMTALHLGLLVCALGELYMTRSRTGLFSGTVGLAMVLGYSVKHMKVSPRNMARIKKMVSAGILMLVIAAVVSEVTNRSISRWLYKASDFESTDMKFGEALTSTRQGLIEQGLDEFKRNPVFGMGFQVNFETARLYGGKGFVLSAPIEKGLLPIMILGEGGIVGSVIFSIFLISFYAGCKQRHLTITIALFTTFLATNIGEATFFSPGGVGGILWTMSIVGGFLLDSLIIVGNRREYMARYYMERYQ